MAGLDPEDIDMILQNDRSYTAERANVTNAIMERIANQRNARAAAEAAKTERQQELDDIDDERAFEIWKMREEDRLGKQMTPEQEAMAKAKLRSEKALGTQRQQAADLSGARQTKVEQETEQLKTEMEEAAAAGLEADDLDPLKLAEYQGNILQDVMNDDISFEERVAIAQAANVSPLLNQFFVVEKGRFSKDLIPVTLPISTSTGRQYTNQDITRIATLQGIEPEEVLRRLGVYE